MRKGLIGISFIGILLIAIEVGRAWVNTDPPVVDITDVTPRTVGRARWNAGLTITGTANQPDFLNYYKVEYRYTNTETAWTQINGNKTESVVAGTLITFSGHKMGEMIEFRCYAESTGAASATDTFPKAGDAITTLQVDSHPSGMGASTGGIIGTM